MSEAARSISVRYQCIPCGVDDTRPQNLIFDDISRLGQTYVNFDETCPRCSRGLMITIKYRPDEQA